MKRKTNKKARRNLTPSLEDAVWEWAVSREVVIQATADLAEAEAVLAQVVEREGKRRG